MIGRRAVALAGLVLATPACSATLNPFAGVRRAVALAHLAIALVVLADIAISKRPRGTKFAWALVVLLFPIVGLAAYLIVGRRD